MWGSPEPDPEGTRDNLERKALRVLPGAYITLKTRSYIPAVREMPEALTGRKVAGLEEKTEAPVRGTSWPSMERV